MGTDFDFVSWEKNGKWAAQRVQSGRVDAKLGLKTKMCLLMTSGKATWECVARYRVAWVQ